MNAKTDPAGIEAAPPPGGGTGSAAREVAQVFGTRVGVYGIGILGQSLLAYLLYACRSR